MATRRDRGGGLEVSSPPPRVDLSRLRRALEAQRALLTPPRWRVSPPIGLCSDLHLPLVDADLLEEFLAALVAHRCRTVAIVGDLLDQEAFSSHPAGLTSPGNRFPVEVDLARQVLLAILAVVDRVFILPGNHDVRILRTLKYQLGMWDLVRVILPEAGLLTEGTGHFLLDGRPVQVIVSRVPRIELEVAGEPWVLLHPASYSRVRGRLATQLADLEEAHVAIGHVHHFSQGRSSNGRWHALELGGLLDPRLLSYLQEQPKPGTAMTTGFFILGPDGPIGYGRLNRKEGRDERQPEAA